MEKVVFSGISGLGLVWGISKTNDLDVPTVCSEESLSKRSLGRLDGIKTRVVGCIDEEF